MEAIANLNLLGGWVFKGQIINETKDTVDLKNGNGTITDIPKKVIELVTEDG